MGVPMLKKKKELNYRRGQQSRNCGGCDYFITRFQETGIGGEPLGIYPRCRIVGAMNGSRYRINPNNQCDAFDNQKGIQRLMGARNV